MQCNISGTQMESLSWDNHGNHTLHKNEVILCIIIILEFVFLKQSRSIIFKPAMEP